MMRRMGADGADVMGMMYHGVALRARFSRSKSRVFLHYPLSALMLLMIPTNQGVKCRMQ